MKQVEFTYSLQISSPFLSRGGRKLEGAKPFKLLGGEIFSGFENFVMKWLTICKGAKYGIFGLG